MSGFSFSFRVGPKASPARVLWLLGVLVLLARTVSAGGASWTEEVPNFALLDIRGHYYELHRSGARAVVLFFTGNGCPVARQNMYKLRSLREKFKEREVAIWVVDAIAEDNRKSIAKEARELGADRILPFLQDDSQGLARLLGVTRTGTAVLISGKEHRVVYSGAVDDQLAEGAAKPEPSHEYLNQALDEFLAGKAVSEASTPSRGCLISYDETMKRTDLSYSRDVAPILVKHCVSCHSPGNIGPFAMSDYQKIKSKSTMIQEVLLGRRMPPWSADTEFGHYVDERTLTLDEKRVLLNWIARGAGRGEGEDPLLESNFPPAPHWPLGKPDAVVKLPVQEIPAAGVLEYRHLKIPAPVTEDTWVGAITIHPDNLKVVHHCIVRVKYPNSEDDGSDRGVWLQGWAPGIRPERFPEGTARRLPKGSILDVEMHYTTMGAAQHDETEIGFYKMAEKPGMILENHAAYDQEFSIPPGGEDAETIASFAVQRDSLLYAMSPHMHLRGSWMRYEALYPDGKREILLSVPHYDFNWQTSYRLLKPKRIPAGSWIICRGGFDNSTLNPSNPDPEKRVAWGDQSFEEMFIGFMEMAEFPIAKISSNP